MSLAWPRSGFALDVWLVHAIWVQVRKHFEITGGALWNWFKAQCYDSAAVALLWLAGLLILRVPWAPFWAVLAGILQFIPHLGPVLGMIGPVLAAMIAKQSWVAGLYVVVVYACIVVIDGLVLQPYLLRRTAKVPFWASLFVPLALGLFLSFWWVLLAAPLLAVLYAYKQYFQRETQRPEIEVLPPESQSQPPGGDSPEPPTIDR